MYAEPILLGGEFKQFYTFGKEGMKYDVNFPLGWSVKHLPHTGPEECEQCATNGCYSGVFVGYCEQCAQIYGEERGCAGGGFRYGREMYPQRPESATARYLNDVSYQEIGTSATVKRASEFDQSSKYCIDITEIPRPVEQKKCARQLYYEQEYDLEYDDRDEYGFDEEEQSWDRYEQELEYFRQSQFDD